MRAGPVLVDNAVESDLLVARPVESRPWNAAPRWSLTLATSPADPKADCV